MKKSIVLSIFGLIVIIGVLVAIKALQIGALIDSGKNFSPPPLAISSAEVKAAEWENTLSAIGSLEAANGLVITADLSGRVSRILFEAGSDVKAGDLLIEQDTSTEKAQLRSATASVALARNNLERIDELYQKQVASKSEFDDAQTSYQSALADADNIRASIEKKSIRAPFDGSLGIRLVNLGQTINAGDPVVSLQATNQMFVNFFLPQQHFSRVDVDLPVRLVSDAVPGKVFQGKINAIDPEIDNSTRSIRLQAIFANPDNELLPGMFGSIDVVLPERSSVLMVPVTAIQYATFGDSVFVIESQPSEGPDAAGQETLQVRQQFVKTGETRGDFVAVEKGLSAGERVVSAGAFKLRTGATVIIDNSAQPDYSLKPEVDNQ
ncbi:MAG: efflux RND transporter periplasmic adaptor subunit [Pseudomonadota bacterium]